MSLLSVNLTVICGFKNAIMFYLYWVINLFVVIKVWKEVFEWNLVKLFQTNGGKQFFHEKMHTDMI